MRHPEFSNIVANRLTSVAFERSCKMYRMRSDAVRKGRQINRLAKFDMKNFNGPHQPAGYVVLRRHRFFAKATRITVPLRRRGE